MTDIKSKNYKKSRLRNFFRFSAKKIIQMGILIIVGEYLLLRVISTSLSEQQPATSYYENISSRLVNIAVREKPILQISEAYSEIRKNLEFDKVIQHQYPIQVKGTRPDFRTLNLQDKEGAKVGYVVKF